jgi:hypothetical protein
MNRRQILSGGAVVSAAALLQACQSFGPNPTAQTITPQLLADANGMLDGIAGLVPQLEGSSPPIISQAQGDKIMADIATARASLQTVSTSTALTPGATVLAKVFGGLNTMVAVLSGLNLQPPYSVALMAVSIVLPVAEAELAQLIGGPAPVSNPPVAAMAAKGKASGMSLSEARAHLGIRR